MCHKEQWNEFQDNQVEMESQYKALSPTIKNFPWWGSTHTSSEIQSSSSSRRAGAQTVSAAGAAAAGLAEDFGRVQLL